MKNTGKSNSGRIIRLRERIRSLRRENLNLRWSNIECFRKINEEKITRASSNDEARSLIADNLDLLMERNQSLGELGWIREEVAVLKGEMLGALRLLATLSDSMFKVIKKMDGLLPTVATTATAAAAAAAAAAAQEDASLPQQSMGSMETSNGAEKRVNKCQPVSPMVSGLVIQKPTVTLQRIAYPKPVIRPGSMGQELLTLSPIQEESHEVDGIVWPRRTGRLGRRMRPRAEITQELLVPLVRLTMPTSGTWLIPERSEQSSESEAERPPQERGESFRGWEEPASENQRSDQVADREEQDYRGMDTIGTSTPLEPARNPSNSGTPVFSSGERSVEKEPGKRERKRREKKNLDTPKERLRLVSTPDSTPGTSSQSRTTRDKRRKTLKRSEESTPVGQEDTRRVQTRSVTRSSLDSSDGTPTNNSSCRDSLPEATPVWVTKRRPRKKFGPDSDYVF